MLKKFCKFILFLTGFYAFSLFLSFILKDDSNSYSRVLRHEFYKQEKIDYLICGASHVSHGIDARIADKEFGRVVFNSGTPAQQIDGTAAILREAVSRYKIEKVFLEMDYGIITSPPPAFRTDYTADYIVLDFLRTPKIKFDFCRNISNSQNLLHSILPIGKNKLMTLSPVKIFAKAKSVLTGEYFKYEYKTPDSVYAGKGCVLDDEKLEPGSLFENKADLKIFKPEDVCGKNIESLKQIVDICREKGIELVFYSQPATNFFIHFHPDYDEYISFLRGYAFANGCKYYDFNLCRDSVLSLTDEDFSDDNHLNRYGVEKYTRAFCDFFTGKYTEQEFFYDSYAQKMSSINEQAFGMLYEDDAAGKFIKVIPVTNNVPEEKITYDVFALQNGEFVQIAEKIHDSKIIYPAGGFGRLRIFCYVSGVLSCRIEKNYFAM